LGLLHDVVEEDALDAAVDGVIQSILSVGPIAAREAKDLVFAVDRPITSQVIDDTVHRIARLRATPEAKEGMAAFFEKRSPAWKK
jgi:methylglutaconyl-CoA hydratase